MQGAQGEKRSIPPGREDEPSQRKCLQLGFRNVQRCTERRDHVQRPSKVAVGQWDSHSWVPRIQEEGAVHNCYVPLRLALQLTQAN